MYKLEIEIGDWDWNSDKVTIETDDFEKAQIIQEFIEFQKNYGWAVEYDVTEEFLANQFDEDEGVEFGEDEEYVYDEETDTWYVYDEESDDFVEYIEYVEDEESEDEAEAEEPSNVTHYVITRVEE